MERRVVVTGMGAITPIGNDVAEFWQNTKKAVHGFAPITYFDTAGYKSTIVGELKNFDPTLYMDKKEARRMEPFCQYAIAAAVQAVDDSKLDLSTLDLNRFGVMVGCGVGGMYMVERETLKHRQDGPGRVSALMVPLIIVNMAAGIISIRFGLKGMCSCVVTACATGTNNIGDAYESIKHGKVDFMLAGGTEASITPVSIAAFSNLSALTQESNPDRASIPFDRERSGFVMGEGAGILVLEEYEHAKKRGAHIYCEIVGYGVTGDAYHMTAPDPNGEGAARALLMAMEEGGIAPCDVDYINAHGTSTPHNDRQETMAIKTALGKHAYTTPISSTKSMTGHLLGAAGVVEAIATIKAMEDSFIPCTLGLNNPDPECDLDYVPNQGRHGNIDVALSNSFGFGGHNAILAFRKVKP